MCFERFCYFLNTSGFLILFYCLDPRNKSPATEPCTACRCLPLPPLAATTRMMWCQPQRAELLSSSHEWALTCWAGSRRQSPSEDDAAWHREWIQHFFISFQSSRTPGAATLKMCRVLPILTKTLMGGARPGQAVRGAACRVWGPGPGPAPAAEQSAPWRDVPVSMRQSLKPFFFDTEIKGKPDKFKNRSSVVLQWDELLPYQLPSSLDSWTPQGNLSPPVAQVQQHLFWTHCGSVGFTWNDKSWARWLHTNQVSTILKTFIIVQLPGTHTYRHVSGNWQPITTFIWLLILPRQSLWDRAVCWISDQASLSHSSCQFTFLRAILPQMSLQFTIMIINGWIRTRPLLHRHTEFTCYTKQAIMNPCLILFNHYFIVPLYI